MDYQKLKMMSVQALQGIKDLIEDVLHNKDFHPDGVDDNMHEICAAAVLCMCCRCAVLYIT
jgi:hypothetical protein